MEPQCTRRRERRTRIRYNADRRSVRNWFERWDELDLETRVLWLRPPRSFPLATVPPNDEW